MTSFKRLKGDKHSRPECRGTNGTFYLQKFNLVTPIPDVLRKRNLSQSFEDQLGHFSFNLDFPPSSSSWGSSPEHDWHPPFLASADLYVPASDFASGFAVFPEVVG